MKPKKIEKIFVEHGFKKWARLLTQIPFLGLKKHSWSKKLRFKGQPDWTYIFRWRGLVSSKILTFRTCSVRLVNTMRIGRSWVPTSIRRAVFFFSLHVTHISRAGCFPVIQLLGWEKTNYLLLFSCIFQGSRPHFTTVGSLILQRLINIWLNFLHWLRPSVTSEWLFMSV